MLSSAIVGLSVTASAVGALVIEVYAAKKISTKIDSLNRRNNKAIPRRE